VTNLRRKGTLLNNLGVGRRLRWLLLASLIAIAIIAYSAALPTSWFRSAEVAGTIFAPPAHTWIVDDDGPAHFQTIQEAINAATPGDTIYVKAGVYYENIIVNKAVSLNGENRDNTIIDGLGTGTGVNITSNNVAMSGFTITNSGWWPNTGICLYKSSNSRITGNNVMANAYSNLELLWSSSNVISENNITMAPYDFSLSLWWSSNNVISGNNITNNNNGVRIYRASYNVVSDNNISANLYAGIFLTEWSNDNIVTGNNITYNGGHGIYMDWSSGNKIVGNNIANNGWGGDPYLIYGIYVGWTSNNKIFHNTLINNKQQLYSIESVNIWDDGYPSGGNYWSDYAGVDLYSGPYQNLAGGDGMGDMPYIIDGNNQDKYPLMSPYEYWSNPIPGDINRDTRVNYNDLFSLASAYGSTPEKPNWNPNADINHDSRVNYKDLYILATNYGKT